MERRVRTADQLRRTDAAAALQGGLWETENSQNTFTDGQGNKYWLIDTTAGNVSVTLPAAADVSPDTIFNVKRTTGGANTLTVTPDSGNIDGSAAHSIATQYAAFGYASDGSNFHIVRQYSPGDFITSASLATALATYYTSASASSALAGKNANILFKDEGTSLSTAGSVTTVNFVGTDISASLTSGVLTVTSTPATSGGLTQVWTTATTSGSSVSTSGLSLTGYKYLYCVWGGISTNLGSSYLIGQSTSDDVTASQAASGGSSLLSGFSIIDLANGIGSSVIRDSGGGTIVQTLFASPMRTSSTTMSLTTSGGNYDAGSFTVYGGT